MCGEKFGNAKKILFSEGSPPRVRGEAGRSLDVYRDEWITPACAGRRCQETQFETTSEDHPRVCGEKHKEPSFGDYWGGSPPRVRGEVVEGLFDPVV